MSTKDRRTASPDTNVTIDITRIFQAPRELVFSMFTDERHMAKWWGPRDFTNPGTRLELRVGGDVWLDMQGTDGSVITNRGEFLEIDEPSRLVFTLRALADADGVAQLETQNTFDFEAIGDTTRLHMVAVITRSNAAVAAAVGGMYDGWNQSLDKLEATITNTAKDTE